MTEEVIIPSNKRLCKCGHCGEWIDVIDKYGKPRFYKKGHRKYRDTSTLSSVFVMHVDRLKQRIRKMVVNAGISI